MVQPTERSDRCCEVEQVIRLRSKTAKVLLASANVLSLIAVAVIFTHGMNPALMALVGAIAVGCVAFWCDAKGLP